MTPVDGILNLKTKSRPFNRGPQEKIQLEIQDLP